MPLAHDLHLARARDLARDLHHALVGARTLARDLDLALALALALAHALTLAHDRPPDLDCVLNRTLDRTRTLDLARAPDLAHTLVGARTFVGALALALDHVLSPVLTFHQRLNSVAKANPRHIRRTVPQSHCARRLTAQLVRLLPADDQARYHEEFAAELDGLVEAEMKHLAQLAYALRLSMRIWSLRSALRAEKQAPRRP